MEWEDLIQTTLNHGKETDEELIPKKETKKKDEFDEILHYNVCGRNVKIANPRNLIDALVEEDDSYYDRDGLGKPSSLKKDDQWEEERQSISLEGVEKGKNHISDVPDDCILIVFSYLDLRDVICVGQVCQNWKHLHRRNRIWRPICRVAFNGNLSYHPDKEKSKYRYYKRKRGDWNKEPFELEDIDVFDDSKLTGVFRVEGKQKKKRNRRRKKKEDNSSRKKRSLSQSKRIRRRAAYYKYWTLFRRRMRIREKEEVYRRKAERKEFVLNYYQQIFSKPKLILDIISYLYLPLVFLSFIVVSLVFMGNFIGFIPIDLYTDPLKQRFSFFFIAGPIFGICMVYTAFIILCIVREWIRAIVNYDFVDGTIFVFYVAYQSFPFSLLFVALKIYFLPNYFSWSAAMSPLYVVNMIVHIALYFSQWKIPIMKWQVRQKFVLGFSATINFFVCWFFVMLCIKMDNQFEIEAPYTQFVFIPLWVFSVLVCCSIPVGGWVTTVLFGWKTSLVIFVPLSVLNLFLCLFFVLLSLLLDGIIPLKLPFVLSVFIPLLFWASVWLFLVMIYFVVMTSLRIVQTFAPKFYDRVFGHKILTYYYQTY